MREAALFRARLGLGGGRRKEERAGRAGRLQRVMGRAARTLVGWINVGRGRSRRVDLQGADNRHEGLSL